jgi:beta-lactamase regulating signal transducer with metallopeptidase domain
MNHLASWISPDVMGTLGWALVHFVWQGIALAALASVAMAMCRSAAARYALGVAALVVMLAAPIVTFAALWDSRADSNRSWAPSTSLSAVPSTLVRRAARTVSLDTALLPSNTQRPIPSNDVLLWFVEAWFAGVAMLSLRTAGGVLLIERMRRKDAKAVSARVQELCLAVQQRLGLRRVIRYCESRLLDAPAVIGWLRPTVLLPITALTGLSEEQLQAVIAHELAHIRRLDNIVNLFQIVVETLLFYHPAVWWLSKQIRAERENCCDDAAISVCGDATEYVRALAQMAESRPAPALAMAANHGPLAARVARLLGAANARSSTRGAGIAGSVILLVSAVVAANAFLGVAHTALGSAVPAHAYNFTTPPPPGLEPASPSPSIAQPHESADSRATRLVHSVATRIARSVTTETAMLTSETASDFWRQQREQKQAQEKEESTGPSAKGSYVEQMRAAGLNDLTVDQLIGLKVQGVMPEYVHAMRDLGLKPDVDELIGMKVQGITPEYIRGMRAAGVNLDVGKLIGMKVQGITPEYVRGMHDLGIDTNADELIRLRVQGVTPDYVKAMKAAGVNTSADTIIGIKVQGITPEYVREMHDLGIPPKADELIGMKVQGVSPEYIKEMRAIGLDVSADRAIGMRVQGITPEYAKGMHDLGFKSGTDELIGMRVQGVTPEYVRDMRAAGLNPTPDQIIGMKVQGVTPEYVKAMRASGVAAFKDEPDSYIAAKVQGITPEFVAEAQKHGFKNLDLDKLISLKNAGIF